MRQGIRECRSGPIGALTTPRAPAGSAREWPGRTSHFLPQYADACTDQGKKGFISTSRPKGPYAAVVRIPALRGRFATKEPPRVRNTGSWNIARPSNQYKQRPNSRHYSPCQCHWASPKRDDSIDGRRLVDTCRRFEVPLLSPSRGVARQFVDIYCRYRSSTFRRYHSSA